MTSFFPHNQSYLLQYKKTAYNQLGNGITNVVVGSGEGAVSGFDPKA